jgi:two-component system response regulator YesN
MKILVVEDEQLALEDLLGMLQPCITDHTITGCTTAMEALADAAQDPPDLVITDIRMPGMGGLELIRQLKTQNAGLAALVLSGHSEFEYAREGVRLGIADYLLKPVRTDILIQRVSEILRLLAEERALTTQLREARLIRILLGGPRAAEADPELLSGVWGVIVTICENWESPVVWRDTPIGRETMTHILKADGLRSCDIVGNDGHIRVILMPLAGIPLHILETAAMRLHRTIVGTGLIIHTTYAIKAVDQSPGALVSDSLGRLTHHMRFAMPTLLFPTTPVEPPEPGALYEYMRLVERALADNRLPAAIAQIHAALEQLRQDSSTQMDVIKTLALIFQLIQRHTRTDQSEALPDQRTLTSLLRRLRSYDELVTWVDLQLQPLLDIQGGTVTPRQLVHALVAHVHRAYANGISLQEFAADHGVSMAYFSRLFKDEIGMTFSDYLTHIRMKKAKELLARGDLRPGEISVLVGYEDPKYFSQVFRRAAGMSPLDYQQSCQRALYR